MGSQSTKQKNAFNVDRLIQSLKLSSFLDPNHCQATKFMLISLHKGQYPSISQFFKSKYPTTTRINQASICCKFTKKDQLLYQCNTCCYFDGKGYFCADCFLPHLHSGHDYQSFQHQKEICSCGNYQLLSSTSFCKNHQKDKKILTPLNPSLNQEIRFFLELLLFLKQQAAILKIQPSSFQHYGQPLLQYLIQAAKSNNSLGYVLLQKVSILTNCQVELKQVGQTLLQNLILVFADNSIICNLLIELLDQIACLQEVNQQLLKIYYSAVFQGDKNGYILNLFKKIKFDTLLSYQNQIKYFDNVSNCKISLQKGNVPIEKIVQYYGNLYRTLLTLTKLKDNGKIFTKIIKQTKLSDIFSHQRYYSKSEDYDEKHRKLIILPYYISRRIIKQISNKQILEKIIHDMLEVIIKKKIIIYDLIYQRTFALAVHKYYDFIFPSKEQLLIKLKSLVPQVEQKIQQMLLKFMRVRLVYSEAYENQLKKNSTEKECSPLSMFSSDHLYLKIISLLLITPQQISSFYFKHIAHDILKVSGGLDKGDEWTQKLKSSTSSLIKVKDILSKFSLFFSTLSNSIIMDVDCFILQTFNNNDPKSAQIILTYLSLIYEGTHAADFKLAAQNFVTTKLVVPFIKERLTLEGKKIHSKGQLKNTIHLFPFSQLFTSPLSDLLFERAISIYCQKPIKNEDWKMFTLLQCLQKWLQLVQNCIEFFQKHPQNQDEAQEVLKKVLEILISLGIQNKYKPIIDLAYRVSKKITGLRVGVEKLMKTVFMDEKIEMQPEENDRNTKKKQKLLDMKEKQKHLLQSYHIQEQLQQRVVQCIVCKNSKSGNPYLLANFSYKNIFDKVLQAETPFLEFSSCGHYMHEECLQESHKGDFKIWYPCILCKSISNILLPNLNSNNESKDDELQRVILFLKNLGAIYTFFYQDRKELIEFNLEKVENVFPLLFKTLAYQITFYPLLNLQSFQRSQLPVTKFLFDLLLFTSKKLPNIQIFSKFDLKGHPFFLSLYQHVIDKLSYNLNVGSLKQSAQNLPSDVIQLVDQIISLLHNNQQNKQITAKCSKGYRDIVAVCFIKPPNDFKELQNKSEQCASCQKSISNFEMCLLCGMCYCAKCGDVKKIHALEVHLSQSVFLRNANGKYTYIHEQLVGEFSSLYVDYLGEEYNGFQKIGENEFSISKQKWENLIEDLLNNRLHREIMKFQ